MIANASLALFRNRFHTPVYKLWSDLKIILSQGGWTSYYLMREFVIFYSDDALYSRHINHIHFKAVFTSDFAIRYLNN